MMSAMLSWLVRPSALEIFRWMLLAMSGLLTSNGQRPKLLLRLLCVLVFGDFGVSDVATVAWRYTRRGGPRLSVQGEPLVVLTRGP